VSVTCGVNTYNEAGRTVTILNVTAVASSGTLGTLTFVERSVSAGLEK
jgi:hypothetical protein